MQRCCVCHVPMLPVPEWAAHGVPFARRVRVRGCDCRPVCRACYEEHGAALSRYPCLRCGMGCGSPFCGFGCDSIVHVLFFR